MITAMIISGSITFLIVSVGSACIMATAAWTDLGDRMKQKILHRLWW